PIRLPAGIGVSNAVDTAHEVVLIVLTARRTNPKRAWTIQPRATALTRRDRGRAHSRPGRHRNNPPAPNLPCRTCPVRPAATLPRVGQAAVARLRHLAAARQAAQLHLYVLRPDTPQDNSFSTGADPWPCACTGGTAARGDCDSHGGHHLQRAQRSNRCFCLVPHESFVRAPNRVGQMGWAEMITWSGA